MSLLIHFVYCPPCQLWTKISDHSPTQMERRRRRNRKKMISSYRPMWYMVISNLSYCILQLAIYSAQNPILFSSLIQFRILIKLLSFGRGHRIFVSNYLILINSFCFFQLKSIGLHLICQRIRMIERNNEMRKPSFPSFPSFIR